MIFGVGFFCILWEKDFAGLQLNFFCDSFEGSVKIFKFRYGFRLRVGLSDVLPHPVRKIVT